MCNPRRIRVQATRRIAEAWKAEIEQAATVTGDVTSEARLTQSIADLLPPAALAAFDQAVADNSEWVWQDGKYRRSVPGGETTYQPGTGEIEIVVQLSAAIEAVGTARLEASGEIVDEIVAEASDGYYRDGFRGRTKEAARARAKAAAEAELDGLAAERKEALVQQAKEAAKHALNQHVDEAKEEARHDAQRRLTLRADEMRQELDQAAAQSLEAVQHECLEAIMQLVAMGYSNALQAYAAQHGENLQVIEEDGVIQIQFEVER